MKETGIRETQRFLRYIIPGIVFFTETALLLWIILPLDSWKEIFFSSILTDKGIVVMVETLIIAGGAGFIFSMVHHWLYWKCDCYGVINHINCIERLRRHKLITLIDATTHDPIPDNEVEVTRKDAWIIVASLWHERLRTSSSGYIKSADPRAQSLSDLVHSIGTSFIASVAALTIAFAISGSVATFSREPFAIVRFFVATVIGLFFWRVHYKNYKEVGDSAQRVIEEILHDDLMANEYEAPVETYVMLQNRNA